MRIRIRHEISQNFEPGSRNMAAIVRLTPRPHEGQFIQRWTLDVDGDACLHAQEDAFGNCCHSFSVEGPADSVTIIAEGEVETQDSAGIVRGTVERFPPALYLRTTELTLPEPNVVAFAQGVPRDADPLNHLHALMQAVHEAVKERPDTPNGDTISAGEVLRKGAACSGSITHLFTTLARYLGLPARHVSGYFATEETGNVRHWAEAHVTDVGWIAFDCGQKLCATENHVRLAVGLDALGVAPLRTSGTGLKEEISVRTGRLLRNGPARNPPASNPPASNPPVINPGAGGMQQAQSQQQS